MYTSVSFCEKKRENNLFILQQQTTKQIKNKPTMALFLILTPMSLMLGSLHGISAFPPERANTSLGSTGAGSSSLLTKQSGYSQKKK
jgi:hypothetical protein